HHLRLLREALQSDGVGRLEQLFDGDLAAQAWLLGEVDGAHSAAAELTLDAILADEPLARERRWRGVRRWHRDEAHGRRVVACVGRRLGGRARMPSLRGRGLPFGRSRRPARNPWPGLFVRRLPPLGHIPAEPTRVRLSSITRCELACGMAFCGRSVDNRAAQASQQEESYSWPNNRRRRPRASRSRLRWARRRAPLVRTRRLTRRSPTYSDGSPESSSCSSARTTRTSSGMRPTRSFCSAAFP